MDSNCIKKMIFLILLLHQVHSKLIEVLHFQKDGVPRKDTQAIYKRSLNPGVKLHSHTMCFRFNLYYFHASATIMKLIDTESNNDEMLVALIWVDRIRSMITGRRKFQALKEELHTNRWHHLCFVYDDNIQEVSSYVDGELNNREPYKSIGPGYGDLLVLGQGAMINADETSLSGQLTQLNVWDRPLSQNEINSTAQCTNDPQGNYVSWDIGWDLYNVESTLIEIHDLCDSRREANNYLWFPKMSQTNAWYICDALGGKLPEVSSERESQHWHNLTKRYWPNETELCATKYWTHVTDEDEAGVWVLGNDPMKVGKTFWAEGEPDGDEYQSCALIYYQGMRDGSCPVMFQCAICQLPISVLYSLKGKCATDKRHVYYNAFQYGMGDLEFRGFGGNMIEKMNKTWVLRERRNGNVMAEMLPSEYIYYPMGRRKWKFYTDICGQINGVKTLLLTACNDRQFTCDDGKCISLKNRCDLKYDCLDHSDEFNCQIVKIPQGYQFDLPPRTSSKFSRSEESLPIIANIIIDFIKVDTLAMNMIASFNLKMFWYDNRLMYINIKAKNSLNKISYTIAKKLWSPSVSYVNTDQGHTHSSIVDQDAQMIIYKESNSTDSDASRPAEVEIYQGSENKVSIDRKYGIAFLCDFDLLLYPFDDQFCDMKLQLTSGTSDYLSFAQNASAVFYLGNPFLLEYEMSTPYLIYGTDEFSTFSIRVPLARRYGYAILNIYIPSFILLVVSYVTLFFRPFIFEVRVMSVLTALLVTATLFTQVSSSLPKTSYFKMIDLWLLYCIAMNFIIIVLHALVDMLLHGESERNIMSPNTQRSFEMLEHKTHPIKSRNPADEAWTEKKWNFFTKITMDGFIYFSRIFVFGIFVVFSLFYWGYILS